MVERLKKMFKHLNINVETLIQKCLNIWKKIFKHLKKDVSTFELKS